MSGNYYLDPDGISMDDDTIEYLAYWGTREDDLFLPSANTYDFNGFTSSPLQLDTPSEWPTQLQMDEEDQRESLEVPAHYGTRRASQRAPANTATQSRVY